MSYQELFDLAVKAAENSYCAYSKFSVGACLLAEDGRTFMGCNFENASFGATICAERCAAGNAIVNGAKRFKAIAVVGRAGADGWTIAWPCGVCRQVLSEFCDDMDIILGIPGGELQVHKLSALLPGGTIAGSLN